MPRSHSNFASAGTRQALREACTFLRWKLTGPAKPGDFDGMFRDIDSYRELYEQLTGRPFSEARVLEIGYGARPNQLIALMSMGIDARGIDLDVPMLQFNPLQLAKVLRRNGLMRALKTGVRSLIFDRRERACLRVALEQRGYSLQFNPASFLVGDAASYDFGSQPADLIYSENVFEHIPAADLENVVAGMARHISPQGLALITPHIYTGISGGHLPEWYRFLADQDIARTSEPWEHLRKRRFTANTYLNCLPRSAYRHLFSRFFEIVEEKASTPDLGRRWLTPEVRAELARWDEEDLFSNRVQFVLRPKNTSGQVNRRSFI